MKHLTKQRRRWRVDLARRRFAAALAALLGSAVLGRVADTAADTRTVGAERLSADQRQGHAGGRSVGRSLSVKEASFYRSAGGRR